ncbi:uncharacterized protein EHS24_001838 [Apiotrichum porosum]|uniref:Uncharacterized protein n=1 Tax=Apiotrichum porosum TaxID=105984 RepID=A0A427XJ38_9TREE|nr:uncharacterized protein EHS24_001838 [Apiotrichum porosum]RSH78915.1 hypothetical protein EHS24_001838 [Apiotrichum porosum]
MPSPADLVGRPFRSEDWTVMDIKNLERMRIGRAAKDVQEVGVILRPSGQSRLLTKLRNTVGTQTLVADATGHTQAADHVDTAALQDEVKRLRVALDKAVKINEKMWNGVVDLKLAA